MENSTHDLLTVVILFGAQPKELRTRLLVLPGSRVVVVANGPQAVGSVDGMRLPGRFEFLRQPDNPGLAVSFNRAANAAQETWALLLDQDSTLLQSGVVRLLDAARSAEVEIAVVTGVVVDRTLRASTSGRGLGVEDAALRTISPVFQSSGTLLRLEAVAKVGGWWEDLFIDLVDAELGVRLRRAGFLQAHVGVRTIEHQLGAVRAVTRFGRTVHPTGHSSERRHSLGTATALVLRRHRLKRDAWPVYATVIRSVGVCVIAEDRRFAKTMAFVIGFALGLFAQNSSTKRGERRR